MRAAIVLQRFLVPAALAVSLVSGCASPDVGSMTVTARGGLRDIPFLADNVEGMVLYDDPAVAVRIKHVTFDGVAALETVADTWPIGVVTTRSIEKSRCRTYMLWSPLEGDDMVIRYVADRPDGTAEWRMVRGPSRFGYAEITYAIRYPNGSASKSKRLRLSLPTTWHY